MTGQRRMSQAISEGDGISLIVPIEEPSEAERAEEQGAEAVLVLSGNERRLDEIRDATSLPILFYWDGQKAGDLAGADACVVEARGDTEWLEHVNLELGDQFELAFKIQSEEHMETLLETFDPEIFLLAPEAARDADDPLENVLDLLPDIPAGKLAIAELEVTTPDEIAELERAGVDAVIVGSQSIAKLVRAAPPEV